jgi:pyruvate-formate lyase-activating enzyme
MLQIVNPLAKPCARKNGIIVVYVCVTFLFPCPYCQNYSIWCCMKHYFMRKAHRNFLFVSVIYEDIYQINSNISGPATSIVKKYLMEIKLSANQWFVYNGEKLRAICLLLYIPMTT